MKRVRPTVHVGSVSAAARAFAELKPAIAAIAASIAFKGPTIEKQVPSARRQIDDSGVFSGRRFNPIYPSL